MKQLLSPLYQQWLPDWLQRSAVQEDHLDCNLCDMTRGCRGPKAKITYEPHLKCCTFEPFIPNFHVGAILKSGTHRQFEQVLRDRWKSKDVLMPLGIAPGRDYQFRFADRKPTDFGNSEALLCSYFDQQSRSCSIWKYRGAVCTAFYCSSQYGKRGERFWKLLGDYLFLFDLAIAEEVAGLMGISPRNISDQLEFITVSVHRAKTMVDLWPREFKDPTAFFLEAHKLACGIQRSDAQMLLGESAKKLEVRLLNQLERMLE